MPEQETTVDENKEQKPLPTATVTITPPKFMAQQKVILTPKEEYDSVIKQIEEAQQKGKSSVTIKHDLQDYAWQKLSQEGYKLQRKVLPRLSKEKNSMIGELDPNRVEFEINLTEFNAPYKK